VYRVSVRDHVMVAHSLPRPFFGPAQGKHGATYVVELVLAAAALDENGVVVDIGAASAALASVLDELRYRDLDEHPAFAGQLTTTEVLARWVADRVVEASRSEGPAAGLVSGLDHLEVVLRETPDAWASYRTDAL